jgi:DNA polymerase-3 subunit epsilon
MAVAAIQGPNGSIKIDGNQITITKVRQGLRGSDSTMTLTLTRRTYILARLARPTDGFLAIMEEYPTMDERHRLHPSRDQQAIVFPKGFPPEPLIEFLQAFWNAKAELPQDHVLVPARPKKQKPARGAMPTGTQWHIDYSSGYLKDYVVLDTETTGFSPHSERIIEIGAIRYINDVEVDRFTSLIRPYTESLIRKYEISEFEALAGTQGITYLDDPYITELTGITNEMLADAPTARQISLPFFDFVGNLPIVGHNIVRFDLGFLRKLASETKVRTSAGHHVFDTLHMAGAYAGGAASKKLKDVGEHLGASELQGAHRAVNDALYTAQVFHLMKKGVPASILEEYRVVDTRHLHALSIQANPERFMPGRPHFGKGFVFTGQMAMGRAEAMQRIADFGGIPLQGVTKKANFLVVAENDGSNPMGKIQKAREYSNQGQDIKIVSESEFYGML